MPSTVGPTDPRSAGPTPDPIDRSIVVVRLCSGSLAGWAPEGHHVAYGMGDWPYRNVPTCRSRSRFLSSIARPSAVAQKDTLASRMGRISLPIHPAAIAALAAPMKNFDGHEESGGGARHGRASASVRGRAATPALRMSTTGGSIRGQVTEWYSPGRLRCSGERSNKVSARLALMPQRYEVVARTRASMVEQLAW